MRKLNNKTGFTLAELLIVVAIIAVLVAIAIPVFSSQLERSRETTDIANIRSAYAEAVANALTSTDGGDSATSVAMTQTVEGWDYVDASIAGDTGASVPDVKNGQKVTITVTSTDTGHTVGMTTSS